MREPVELEVIDARRAFIEVVQHVRELLGAVDRVHDERRHALQRDIDEDAECSETRCDSGKQLGVLRLVDGQEVTGCRHQRRTHDLRGDAAEPGPCAVRARGDGARDRLAVDVAEILHREPVRGEQLRHLVQTCTREQPYPLAFTVDLDHAAQVLELEQHVGRDRDPAEAVSRPDRLHTHA